MRGEQSRICIFASPKQGSPPLARGTVLPPLALCVLAGITPACAGNSASGFRSAPATGDHPRLRGEQSQPGQSGSSMAGSPPLARGTGTRCPVRVLRPRITPACAGNRLKKDLLYLVFYNIVFHFSISFS